MSQEGENETRARWERSPSYPFISLRKAVERARALYENHRREPARLVTIAGTWGYGVKSSGLQQTVGALKQYGLLEDMGSGEDRKVQISELARKILVDQRPGERELALREAATNPRMFAEYSKWYRDRPSDDHCVSELVFERGFNDDAAKTFLRSFDETVEYAGLANGDSLSVTPLTGGNIEESAMPPVVAEERPLPAWASAGAAGAATSATPPFSRRLEVKMGAEALTVSAILVSQEEVDRLISILEANKILLRV